MKEYETLNKKWKIYIVHQTHTDIGYTDGQEIITARQIDFIRQAIEISEAILQAVRRKNGLAFAGSARLFGVWSSFGRRRMKAGKPDS